MIGWLQPRAQRYRFLPEGRTGSEALPWIIDMMTFLAALALAGGFALSTATDGLTRGLTRSFTVQIVEADPIRRDAAASTIMALLRDRDDIVDVTRVSDTAMRTLLEPWLGTGNIGEELPLPAMIDAQFADGVVVDTAALDALVRGVAPSVRVDDHAQWFAPLAGIVETLKWLAIIIGVLVTIATTAIVALGVRSGLNTYQSTIETLHMMGAEDGAIADVFQYRYAVYGLTGGLVGFVAAFAMIVLIGQFLDEFGGGLAGTAGLTGAGWLLLFLLPFAVTVLAMLTARLTVLRTLKAQL